MPSQTFYNLPPAKREKLLRAARAEFARVPYDQVSINRIVRAAGIPRGSFYMYFSDKEELFRYLMEDCGRQMTEDLACRLRQAEGDVFAAFQALFEYLAGRLSQGGEGMADELMAMFRHNACDQPRLLFSGRLLEQMTQMLAPLVDWSALALETEEELGDLLALLCHLTGIMVGPVLTREGEAETRARYRRMLTLMRHGASRPPKPVGCG